LTLYEHFPEQVDTYRRQDNKGEDMLATHKGINIDRAEFLAALRKNNIGQREQEEVLYIFYSMKSDIVSV
jgi:hemoglobin